MTSQAPSPRPPADPADGVPLPRRYFAGTAIVLAIIMAVLDNSMLTVALPAMAGDLAVPAGASVWIVSSYQIAIVASLIPMTRFGEMCGFRRVLMAGIVVFVAASVVCAYSPSLWPLVAARTAQGVGAAAIFGMIGAFLRLVYPRATLGRAIGFNASVVGVTAAAGPAIGSAILSLASWPILFLINVPIGALALAAATALPERPRAVSHVDALGMGLNALTWALLVVGLNQLASLPILGAAAILLCVPTGALLVRRSLGQSHPLFPIDLLRRPVFRSAATASFFFFAAQMGAFVALPFLLHDVHRMDYAQIGPLMMAWPLAAAVTAAVAGALADRVSETLLCVAGTGAITAGLVVMILPVDLLAGGGIGVVAGFCGVGAGLFQSPNNRAMINDAPHTRGVSESGIRAMAREIGMAFGTGLVGLGLGLSAANGPRLGLGLAMGCAFFAFVVTLHRLLARHD